MITWKDIHHFVEKEFADSFYKGSGQYIDMKLVLNLDYIWERVHTISGKKPKIIITQAVDVYGEHGHAEKSYHLKTNNCLATDFFIVTSLSPREQYGIVEKQGFGGIGCYYDWKYKGEFLPIGFHADMRPHTIIQRWTRRNGQYSYLLGRDN